VKRTLRRLKDQWNYLRSQPGFRKAPAKVLIRLLQWRCICGLHRPVLAHLPARALVFHLLPEWHGAGKLIYILRDDYEPDLVALERFLTAGKTFVDVGANYGVFSLVASRLVGPQGRIAAFEPAQKTFSAFERNLALNRITNVQALRLALSDHSGKARLYHEPDATRNSLSPSLESQGSEEVETRTLDEVFPGLGMGRLDFLKIDAEGADGLVCRGAVETLRKYSPPVMFEYYRGSAARMGLSEDEPIQLLSSLGYRFHRFEGLGMLEVEAVNCPQGNILALHPDRAHPA